VPMVHVAAACWRKPCSGRSCWPLVDVRWFWASMTINWEPSTLAGRGRRLSEVEQEQQEAFRDLEASQELEQAAHRVAAQPVGPLQEAAKAARAPAQRAAMQLEGPLRAAAQRVVERAAAVAQRAAAKVGRAVAQRLAARVAPAAARRAAARRRVAAQRVAEREAEEAQRAAARRRVAAQRAAEREAEEAQRAAARRRVAARRAAVVVVARAVSMQKTDSWRTLPSTRQRAPSRPI
jgi:colicin import membrane protein